MPSARIAFAAVCLTAAIEAFANCELVPHQAETYVREHKAYHFNGDPPSVVEDELALWKAENGDSCFSLRTIGANYHECEVFGTASALGRNNFEFKNGTCTLAFERRGASVKVIASPGWERIGRGGVCPKNSCGMFGEIESGTFRATR